MKKTSGSSPVKPQIYRIALVAHDAKKRDIEGLCQDYLAFLATCKLCATGTTAQRIRHSTALKIEGLLSGPLGGDLQIGARLASGKIDAVIFLRDPMTAQPHEPDINALIRACDVHNVPCATNMASARMLLQTLSWIEAGHE
jgi:methylglyoxal synthase